MLHIRPVRLHYTQVALPSILYTVQSHDIHNRIRDPMDHRRCNLFHHNTTLRQLNLLLLRLLSIHTLGNHHAKKAPFSSNGTDWIAWQRSRTQIYDKGHRN